MSRKMISGVLEHLIFELRKKGIDYEIKDLGKEHGYPEQIILDIREKELFIYIIKKKKKVTYYISERGEQKRNISKQMLLQKIKEL